jgi:hypothetical protein
MDLEVIDYLKGISWGLEGTLILYFALYINNAYYRLVYNVRDLSEDPTNERERERKDLEADTLRNEAYAQDILGNTEVDIELFQNGASPDRNRRNVNLTNQINASMNSARNNQETNVPQNLITHFANNDQRFNIMNINTENEDPFVSYEIDENLNSNPANLDRQLTAREGDGMQNGFMLDNSAHNLLNNTPDKKPYTKYVS